MADLLAQIGQLSEHVVFSFDLLTNRFQHLSAAFETLLARAREEAMADPATLLHRVHPDDQPFVVERWQRLLAGADAEEFQCRVQLPNGEVKTVRVEVYRLPDASGGSASLTGFVRDISQQKQYEEYLVKFGTRKNAALEVVSHDLRGPLALVQSITHAIEDDFREGQLDEVQSHLSLIKRACTDCSELINDLLVQEHLQAPDIHVKKEWLDVVGKARLAAETYQLAPNISQQIVVQAQGEQVFAELDKTKIGQIINNLISNSVKFTPPDGTVTVRVQEEKEHVRIEVVDNGIGIPQHLLPTLFDKYTKSSRPGLRGEKSRGIGLSIVRELVEVQGGKIWADSEEQRGTTITLVFPKRS